MKWRLHPRPVLGVSVGSDRVAATLRGHGGEPQHWSRQVPVGAAAATAILEILSEVLREARAVPGAARASLSVALLSPLAQCRLLDLPGLRDTEVQAVLARDAARFFPVGTAPHVAGTRRQRRGPGARQLLAAVSPVSVIDAIHSAAAAAGWQVGTIVPAVAGWAVAAHRAAGGTARTRCAVVVVESDRTEVLVVVRGQIVALRRFRGVAAHGHAVVEAMSGATHVMLIGEPGAVESFDSVVRSSSARIVRPALDPGLLGSPEALAAAFAADVAAGPFLVSEQMRAAERRDALRRAARMLAASALLLASAGALELWGTHRELAAVATQRAALRRPLANVLSTRDTVSLLAQRVALLGATEAAAQRWSDAVGLVAAHLPQGAYLLSLRGEGDSLLLDGVARRAATVFEAMAADTAVLAVRPQGSIRQELRDDVGKVERFTLSIHILSRSRPAMVADSTRTVARAWAPGDGGAP